MNNTRIIKFNTLWFSSKKIILNVASILFLFLSACSIDANLNVLKDSNSSKVPEERNRVSPDIIHGEVVTTTSGTAGYEVQGTIGEISEKTTSLNGNNWQVEAVFYE